MTEEFDDQKSLRGFDEYWAMVVRRRWWILGPLFLGWLIVFASAWIIPPKYTSETVILVEQQKVPEQFVMPNVQVDLQERLQSIQQQVLSRSRLLSIINELHLYQGLFFGSPDDQVMQMRKDITIDLVQAPASAGRPGALTAFKVSFVADKPQSNLQILTGTQGQLQSAVDARDKALQQQAYLNSLAAQYDAMGVTESTATTPQTTAQQIEMMRAELANLEAKYTSDHPDVKKQKDAIAKMEQMQKDTTDTKSGEAADDVEKSSPSQVRAMTPVMQIQSELKSNKLEIQSREALISRLEAKVNLYQARLNATPGRQQELSDIMRNYDESKKNYDTLLGKTMASSLATSLNRQQQGDQFRIIDPPSLPEKASFPDRFKFSLAGLGAGLALAFIFGVGMEFVDARIRSETDLIEGSTLPVLAEIPPLPTDREVAAQRWKPWIAVAAAILIAIIIPTGIWYAYFWG